MYLCLVHIALVTPFLDWCMVSHINDILKISPFKISLCLNTHFFLMYKKHLTIVDIVVPVNHTATHLLKFDFIITSFRRVMQSELTNNRIYLEENNMK